MLIDRGADYNVAVGSHFAIYRDREVTGLPLTPIGEATVVSVGPTLSVVRITQARDAVLTRDVVVPRGPARAGGSGARRGGRPRRRTRQPGRRRRRRGRDAARGNASRDRDLLFTELTEYGRLMADGSTREASGHLKAAGNIVRAAAASRQDIYQGAPSEFSLARRPTRPWSQRPATSTRWSHSAIRQLTEYGSLMVDSVHQPPNVPLDATPYRQADERLTAARRTVDRLQHLPR